MTEKEDIAITEHIVECLESTPIAVLSTSDKSGAWATPIYFTYDDKFNFYLLSEASTRHVRDVRSNPRVALAIVMPASESEGLEVGIQIAGIASVVPEEDVEEVFEKRGLRLVKSGEGHYKISGNHKVRPSTGFFIKITPKIINYLDRRYHGPDGHKISIRKLIKLNKYYL